MADGAMKRRDVLKVGTMLGVAGALGAARPSTVEAQKEPGYRLVVDIPGLPCVSASITAVEIEPLQIDAATRGQAPDGLRIYAPGDAHYGRAKFTSACTLGGSKELQAWWQEAAKGKNIRKNITVTLFKSDKSPGRSYTLFDCFPTRWSSVNFDTSSTVQCESVTVKMGRVELG